MELFSEENHSSTVFLRFFFVAFSIDDDEVMRFSSFSYVFLFSKVAVFYSLMKQTLSIMAILLCLSMTLENVAIN